MRRKTKGKVKRRRRRRIKNPERKFSLCPFLKKMRGARFFLSEGRWKGGRERARRGCGKGWGPKKFDFDKMIIKTDSPSFIPILTLTLSFSFKGFETRMRFKDLFKEILKFLICNQFCCGAFLLCSTSSKDLRFQNSFYLKVRPYRDFLLASFFPQIKPKHQKEEQPRKNCTRIKTVMWTNLSKFLFFFFNRINFTRQICAS